MLYSVNFRNFTKIKIRQTHTSVSASPVVFAAYSFEFVTATSLPPPYDGPNPTHLVSVIPDTAQPNERIPHHDSNTRLIVSQEFTKFPKAGMVVLC